MTHFRSNMFLKCLFQVACYQTFENVLIVPVIESTFPLSGSTASKDSTSLATTGRWLARRWSAQSGSRCTPMLVCAFVPVRSNLRGNISFLSNWPRTRARRCRAPWVPRTTENFLGDIVAISRAGVSAPDAAPACYFLLCPFFLTFLFSMLHPPGKVEGRVNRYFMRLARIIPDARL